MTDKLIQEVQTRMSDAEFRAELLTLLQKSRIIRESIQDVQHYRTEVAAKMLCSGMPRNEIVTSMCERFNLSRATSYRLIDKALNRSKDR